MTYTHVFFDLDGTLSDSQTGIINAIRYALRSQNLPTDIGDARRFLGPPLIDSMQNYLGHDRETAVVLVKQFREYYGSKGLFENTLYDGIQELLESLNNSGVRCILATSKGEPFALRILEHFGIRDLFSFVAAAALDGSRDAKADVLRHALNNTDLHNPAQAIMIGDRKHDVIGAHAVGLQCAAVLYGYGSREELENAGADHIIPTVADLRGLLHK